MMAAMERTGTTRLIIKKDNFEVQLEREPVGSDSLAEPSKMLYEEQGSYDESLSKRADQALSRGGNASTTPPTFSGLKAQRGYESEEDDELFRESKSAKGQVVKSPMVGTFYLTPGPDEPVFVKIGDQIEEDTVLCIIEAMKVMNEIKSGLTGKVAEVFVESGHPVEFGTPLFRIV